MVVTLSGGVVDFTRKFNQHSTAVCVCGHT